MHQFLTIIDMLFTLEKKCPSIKFNYNCFTRRERVKYIINIFQGRKGLATNNCLPERKYHTISYPVKILTLFLLINSFLWVKYIISFFTGKKRGIVHLKNNVEICHNFTWNEWG